MRLSLNETEMESKLTEVRQECKVSSLNETEMQGVITGVRQKCRVSSLK